MIRLCACVIVAIGAFSVNEAIAQTVGVTLREKDAGQTSPNTEQLPAAPKDAGARQPPPGGNPLWGIPLKLLSATRDRPIFSASRRPPPIDAAPAAVAVAPPVQAPKPPERPQLSLVGTIVNGDDGFAIFLDQNTRAPLRLRMGADYQQTQRLIRHEGWPG